MSPRARALLARALERRAPLREGGRTTAFRWLNGAADGTPGLTLDLFGDVGVLSTYDAQDPTPVADAAMALLPLRAVYAKARPREAGTLRGEERAARAPALPLRGEPVEVVEVREQGLAFRIRPGEGLAVGLYLDMREAAQLLRLHRGVRDRSAGRWRGSRGGRRPEPALTGLGRGERAAERAISAGGRPHRGRRVGLGAPVREAG